jgi:hypothetical protein
MRRSGCGKDTGLRGGLRCLAFASFALACGSRSGLLGSEFEREAGLDDAPVAVGPAPPASLLPLPLPEPEPTQQGCVDITRSYTSVPPTVMLLIDQSQSMTERFGMGTRWSVLREAIVDPNVGLLAWLDSNSSLGLMLYSSLEGFAFGRQCPLLERVEVALGNADAIRAAYLAQDPLPGGDTPTPDSIDQAVLALNAAPAGAKYILLVTDGQPDTCAQPDPQNGLEEAVAAAQNAFAQGIRVYSVGVSPEIARRPLQAMANAGAGKDPDLTFGTDPDAEEPLYASSDPRDLAAQLRGIIGDVRTCSVELGEDVGRGRAFDGELSLDGAPLRFGDINGWTFVDDDTLLIHGASCERILGDGERLEIRFPCTPPFSPR